MTGNPWEIARIIEPRVARVVVVSRATSGPFVRAQGRALIRVVACEAAAVAVEGVLRRVGRERPARPLASPGVVDAVTVGSVGSLETRRSDAVARLPPHSTGVLGFFVSGGSIPSTRTMQWSHRALHASA